MVHEAIEKAADMSALFDFMFMMLGLLGGWLLNSMRESIRELHKMHNELSNKVQRIEVNLVGHYVTRDSMQAFTDRIYEKLEKIEQKIDSKADK